jgi:hypothetical protein
MMIGTCVEKVTVVTEEFCSRRIGIERDDWDMCGESDSCDREISQQEDKHRK